MILTNTSFSQLTSFSVGSQITTFDAFVTPPTVAAVPEPASLTLMAIGLGALRCRSIAAGAPWGPRRGLRPAEFEPVASGTCVADAV